MSCAFIGYLVWLVLKCSSAEVVNQALNVTSPLETDQFELFEEDTIYKWYLFPNDYHIGENGVLFVI